MTIIILWIFIISLFLGLIAVLITIGGTMCKIIVDILIGSVVVMVIFKIRGRC